MKGQAMAPDYKTTEGWRVGDLVCGSSGASPGDLHRIVEIDHADADTFTIECIREPVTGWAKLGERTYDLTRRYRAASPGDQIGAVTVDDHDQWAGEGLTSDRLAGAFDFFRSQLDEGHEAEAPYPPVLAVSERAMKDDWLYCSCGEAPVYGPPESVGEFYRWPKHPRSGIAYMTPAITP